MDSEKETLFDEATGDIAVGELGAERHYRLIQAPTIAWRDAGPGMQDKILVDHGAVPSAASIPFMRIANTVPQ